MNIPANLLRKTIKEVQLSGLPVNTKSLIIAALEDDLPDRIIRPKDMVEVSGMSLSTIERMEKEGDFPKRRKLGRAAVGWSYKHDYLPWLDSCQRATSTTNQ